MQKVKFKTEDGITIVGNYWEGKNKAALLLHMMPATKESWNEFADKLNLKGYTVLAIDERGHGESTEGGKLNYKRFSEKEQQAKILDIKAARKWLGAREKKLSLIVGASIGANLALWYQVEKKLPISTVLLSSGYNYRGIETKPYAQKLFDPQAVFYAGAELDDQGGYSCADVAKNLYDLSRIINKKLFISKGGAHGTDLFQEESELMEEILEWVK